MKKHRFLPLILALVLGTTVFLSCSPPNDDEKPDPNDNKPPVIIIVPPEDIVIDPLKPLKGYTYEPLAAVDGYTLTFRDEFEGAQLNEGKWEYMLAKDTNPENPWGNHELQFYQKESAVVSDNSLKVTAKREETTYTAMVNEKMVDEDGEPVLDEDGKQKTQRVEKEFTMDFTSARIRTRGHFAQKYGRFEAKIKLPAVVGMWPAFWMMPEEGVYGGWPRSGEIDIMEARGREPQKIDCTLHFGRGNNGGHNMSGGTKNFSKAPYENWTIEEFHVYRVDWSPGKFEWYIDDELVTTKILKDWERDNTAAKAGARGAEKATANAPFDQAFHMLLNLAVGGDYDGGKVPPASFEQGAMEVDYVRVWQKNDLPEDVLLYPEPAEEEGEVHIQI